MKRFFPTLPIVLACVWLLHGASPAACDDATWHTIDGGGNTVASSGGGFEVAGTIGQPDASSPAAPMSGGSFSLVGGFWPVANVCYCPGDMNLDGLKNGGDIQQFVACMISGGSCSCADVDAAPGLSDGDVSVFVADLLSGATCP